MTSRISPARIKKGITNSHHSTTLCRAHSGAAQSLLLPDRTRQQHFLQASSTRPCQARLPEIKHVSEPAHADVLSGIAGSVLAQLLIHLQQTVPLGGLPYALPAGQHKAALQPNNN